LNKTITFQVKIKSKVDPQTEVIQVKIIMREKKRTKFLDEIKSLLKLIFNFFIFYFYVELIVWGGKKKIIKRISKEIE
jgi:hypothetical protein